MTTRSSKISRLLMAQSVAIVGASSDPTKITGRPIEYMQRLGFRGKIFPVNPSRRQVQGLKSYPSLGSIGEPIDLVIVATAADQVKGIVEEGIAAGVGGFVVFSAGFAEVGEQGAAWQAELAALARAHDVPIVGPNCIGMINARSAMVASFTSALEKHALKPGGFGFASQSGALAAYWLDIVLGENLNFSKWLSTGNEVDVDISDALNLLVEDDETKVIGLYIEDVKNPALFRAGASRAVEMGKPIIVIKAGRSVAGATAALSHTGAVAGDDAAYQALFDECGIIRVRSLTEMIGVARIFSSNAIPSGERFAIMTVSGGAGVLIADDLDEAGLGLANFSSETATALAGMLPGFSKPQNPIDLTAAVMQNAPIFTNNMRIATDAAEVDALIVFIGAMESISGKFSDALEAARQRSPKPIIVIWIGAPASALERLRAAGIPVFADISPAVTALARVRDYERARGSASAVLQATASAASDMRAE